MDSAAKMVETVAGNLARGYYTMPCPSEAVTVPVAEFRRAIEHLERRIRADYSACVDASERANWAEVTRRIGCELLHMICKRATVDDMNRRERALDRSTVLLIEFSGR